MGQYDYEEYMLPKYVHHDATNHGYPHFDAVNRTWIHLKRDILPFMRPVSSLITHTIDDTFVCDAASLAEAMVSELRVRAAANVSELFVQTLVLPMTLILDCARYRDPRPTLLVIGAVDI
ncbi:hypothetical protein TNCV_2052801 [Trichonephila clavipes]|nr:hypothetical protein TNCV_2052801 [Trichonephila clavipes]